MKSLILLAMVGVLSSQVYAESAVEQKLVEKNGAKFGIIKDHEKISMDLGYMVAIMYPDLNSVIPMGRMFAIDRQDVMLAAKLVGGSEKFEDAVGVFKSEDSRIRFAIALNHAKKSREDAVAMINFINKQNYEIIDNILRNETGTERKDMLKILKEHAAYGVVITNGAIKKHSELKKEKNGDTKKIK